MYVPILKAKAGEIKALRRASSTVKEHIRPIWEIVPDRKRTAFEDVERRMKALCGASAGVALQSLDTASLPEPDQASVLARALAICAERSTPAIPVVTLHSGESIRREACSAMDRDQRGMCLRASLSDLVHPNTLAIRASEAFGVAPGEIDLLIDAATILPGQQHGLALGLNAQLRDAGLNAPWRSMAVAAGGFPQDLAATETGAILRFRRLEWELWRVLASLRPPRMPDFGDYSPMRCKPTQVDPRVLPLTANLRYTAEDEWLVVRGTSTKKEGCYQYRELCRRLIETPEYQRCGRDFSWGDMEIDRCEIDMTRGPGNLGHWVAVRVSHHLAFVVHQLATLTGV